MNEIRTTDAVRYVLPLREGGSLPALVDADDGFKYVLKFRGGGHGAKALIAEFIGGEIARAAGMRVPELVFVNLDEDFGRTEGDEEIQDLLQASRGLNLGLHFLSGALTWDVVVNTADPMEASRIVWLDAFITNVDRTWRNTNMLLWHGRELWLIDHGASLYFHHNWTGWEKAALSPFPYINISRTMPCCAMHPCSLRLIPRCARASLPKSSMRSWPPFPTHGCGRPRRKYLPLSSAAYMLNF